MVGNVVGAPEQVVSGRGKLPECVGGHSWKFLESDRPSSTPHGPSVDTATSIDSSPNASKYKAIYEDSMNPFTVFNPKQKAFRKEKMDLQERIMLEAAHSCKREEVIICTWSSLLVSSRSSILDSCPRPAACSATH